MLAIAAIWAGWMDGGDVAPWRVDRCVIAESASGMRCVPGARGLDPLLDYLKYEGVLAESPAPASPVEVLVGA